jgi:hypothetical protein
LEAALVEVDYARIRDGLRMLREANPAPKVFGAEAHGFRCHPPLSEAAVREFEDRHRIRLPPDYRGFLVHVGDGGTGPAWGLFKLGEMDSAFRHKRWKENDGFVGTLAEPFPHAAAWNDRAGEPEYDESREDDPAWEDEYERRLNAWEQTYWNPKNVNGAVPICHLGCAIRQWLVVTGREAGHVWDDDRANLEGLKPLRQNGRERVTFGQWYGDWLDEALRELGSGG